MRKSKIIRCDICKKIMEGTRTLPGRDYSVHSYIRVGDLEYGEMKLCTLCFNLWANEEFKELNKRKNKFSWTKPINTMLVEL